MHLVHYNPCFSGGMRQGCACGRQRGVALESRGRWGFASFGTCRSLARPCLANVSDMTLEDSQIHLAGLVTLYSNWSPLEWWGIEWVCPDEQFVPQLAQLRLGSLRDTAISGGGGSSSSGGGGRLAGTYIEENTRHVDSAAARRLGEGYQLCAPSLHSAPCTVLSLGSNYDASFEAALFGLGGCGAYVVDPTVGDPTSVATQKFARFAKLDPDTAPDTAPAAASAAASASTRRSHLHAHGERAAAAFAAELTLINATLNRTVGVGPPGATVGGADHHVRGKPCVPLRQLLRDNSAVLPRHFAVVKVDIEGAEYDVLRDALDLCREGSLSMDTLLVEIHLGGALRSAPPKGRGGYALHELAAIFARARADCGLLLHAQRITGGCMSGRHKQGGRPVPRCAVFSWVSQRHARRAWHAAQKRTKPSNGLWNKVDRVVSS